MPETHESSKDESSKKVPSPGPETSRRNTDAWGPESNRSPIESLGRKIDERLFSNNPGSEYEAQEMIGERQILLTLHGELSDRLVRSLFSTTTDELSDFQVEIIQLRIERMPPSAMADTLEAMAGEWERTLPYGRLTPRDQETVKIVEARVRVAQNVADKLRSFRPAELSQATKAKDVEVESDQSVPSVIRKIRELATKEIDGETDNIPLARVFFPAYEAFVRTIDADVPDRERRVANRLTSLRDQAMRTATGYFNEGKFPRQDLEFCFSKVVREEVFPSLPRKEIDSLTNESRKEKERQLQKQREKYGEGLLMAIEVKPEIMLDKLLWSIREV